MKRVKNGWRRRWTVEEKVRIVAAGLRGDWPVSAVARHHALAPSQLFTWRRAYREGRLNPEGEDADAAAGFIPAVITPEATAETRKGEGSGNQESLLASQCRGRMEMDTPKNGDYAGGEA